MTHIRSQVPQFLIAARGSLLVQCGQSNELVELTDVVRLVALSRVCTFRRALCGVSISVCVRMGVSVYLSVCVCVCLCMGVCVCLCI